MANKALVVFSGGQDSTICLHLAHTLHGDVEAVTFAYGQRHAVEVERARMICARRPWVTRHHVVNIDGLQAIASSLTDPQIAVGSPGTCGPLPSSFVPGRNVFFLSIAAGIAHSRGIHTIVTGVCQTDYSGYPDCRRGTIDALTVTLRLAGLHPSFEIVTPLMNLTKADTVLLARRLGAACWSDLAVSSTCYLGTRCGGCDACILRQRGFDEAGLEDPAND